MRALSQTGISAQDPAKIEARLPKQADRDMALALLIAQLEDLVRTGQAR